MAKKMPRVVYFCMEYGLESAFRIYAGGLGVLAGDVLKGARDLRLPLIGVGILWRQGYTKQIIGTDGFPIDVYPVYRYDFLKDTGIKVKVLIRGRQVICKVWLVDTLHNAALYLLDTYLPENEDPWITGQLYGWFSEERIAQEMILGIGGVRAIQALGIKPDIYHFNEGHALFAGLELIREQMAMHGRSFEEARDFVRRRIVFTTHTPIKEGNEKHDYSLLRYMGADSGLTYGQMLSLGGDPFNMTVGCLRLARIANGVSKLHGRTTKKMWADVEDVPPIISITNGIHEPTWQNPAVKKAFHDNKPLRPIHLKAKETLLEFIRARTGRILDREKLLIGFGRRAAPYKRSSFIFRDMSVIGPLLKQGRLQLVFSGKGHPLDSEGKKIIAELIEISRSFPDRVVFLPDYDLETAKYMTQGCDVWLNNPIRPLEASGTSGMKAAVNGVLNCSTLDGWWPEACIHGINGWQFGDGYEGPGQDQRDLAALYHILLKEVIPTYYHNGSKWEEMMKASINTVSGKFSIGRMLNEYYQQMYS
ncbi:MAG: alpha-glucan family phosphorylase [Bacillota bacterium]